jgi:hypothetical protein
LPSHAEYYGAVLRALEALGGSAELSDIVDYIRKHMGLLVYGPWVEALFHEPVTLPAQVGTFDSTTGFAFEYFPSPSYQC